MSDELTLGGPPGAQWSNPSPVYNSATGRYETDGMVFWGNHPVTEQDMWDLYDYLTSSPYSEWETLEDMFRHTHLDKKSLVGKYHPDWSSHSNDQKDPKHRNGGLGSDTYKRQRVGSGVKFADKPIWYFKADGEMVKEVPPNCGAYHYDDTDEVNREGPEPESDAAKILGDSVYYWDSVNQWWDVENPGVEVPLPPEPTITECPHCVVDLIAWLSTRP